MSGKGFWREVVDLFCNFFKSSDKLYKEEFDAGYTWAMEELKLGVQPGVLAEEADGYDGFTAFDNGVHKAIHEWYFTVDKRKQKKQKRLAAAYKPPVVQKCSNCGKPGSHFVPPSIGEEGFYACMWFNK